MGAYGKLQPKVGCLLFIEKTCFLKACNCLSVYNNGIYYIILYITHGIPIAYTIIIYLWKTYPPNEIRKNYLIYIIDGK